MAKKPEIPRVPQSFRISITAKAALAVEASQKKTDVATLVREILEAHVATRR